MNSPNQYEGIVSSLPNLSMESSDILPSLNLANQYADFIAPEDLYLLRLVYMPTDHANLLNYLYQLQQDHLPNGNFTQTQITQIATGKLTPYPYIDEFFINHWHHNGSSHAYVETETELNNYYYSFLLTCGNPFVEKWARFTLELHNYSLLQYKTHGLPDLSAQLVAKNEVAYLVGKYQANAEQESLIPLAQVIEIWTHENPLVREKMLDTVKWQFLQTEQFFYYFTIEHIIAHALQRQIASRWAMLNRQPAHAQGLSKLVENAFNPTRL